MNQSSHWLYTAQQASPSVNSGGSSLERGTRDETEVSKGFEDPILEQGLRLNTNNNSGDKMDIDISEGLLGKVPSSTNPLADPAKQQQSLADADGDTMMSGIAGLGLGSSNATPSGAKKGKKDDLFGRLQQQANEAARTEALKKEEADKKEAERKRTESQKTKRAGSPLSADKENKKARPSGEAETASFVSTPMEMDPEVRISDFDFSTIFDKVDSVNCAIRINDSQIIGSPFGGQQAFNIKLLLDPGAAATPSVGLDFKISKDGTGSRKADHYHTFNVGSEPGVKIGGKYMMENLLFERANQPSHPQLADATLPPEIRKMCKDQKDADRLFQMSYQVNSHKKTHYDSNWPLGLPEGRLLNKVWENMDALMNESGAYTVDVWFKNPKSYFDEFERGCLHPLKHAVDVHLQPHHQYLDKDGQPVIKFDMPSINVIGNGMYKRYATKKGPDGKRIADKNGKVSYFNLPKQKSWASIKHLYIQGGVGIVREHQFTTAQHISLGGDWHRIFLERMPVFTVDGKEVTPDKHLFSDSYYAGVRMQRRADDTKDDPPPNGSIIKVNFYNGVEGRTDHTIDKREIWYGKVEGRTRAWLDATGCDFCVMVAKPRGFKGPDGKPIKSYKTPQHRPDGALPKARIEVKVNMTPAKRDLKAFGKFCNVNYQTELLDEIRVAICSDPIRTPPGKGKAHDLTHGPKDQRSEANKKVGRLSCRIRRKEQRQPQSDQRLPVLKPHEEQDRPVRGPPGTGKTRTLKSMIVAMA
ncbi:hypothetical protein OEA41_005403 [Lepraria neglecta]|uniref:Uncharacterized protein n=1 Tax=Lepraria neglecta TaxID=209136 RepID=A0AAE0DH05_9LECA|nr:hypothetical protein OEA41_005403 [Lepraria neglecta]